MINIKFYKHVENKCVYKNFIYTKDSLKSGNIVFSRILRKCPGRIYIKFNKEVEIRMHHNQDVRYLVLLTKHAIRKKIEISKYTEYYSTQVYDIINKKFHQYDILLFNKKAIYMAIYKYKKYKNNEFVSAEIPENYIYTIQNDKILFHDSGKSDIDRFIIFGTIENLIN
ncbi:hypothetical protein DMUE_4853 [Dictyocoela muelleri]|nr:hypothetical protein DMUE_4853 [Dictyocoela muelleri]